jgi:hypothetical protein
MSKVKCIPLLIGVGLVFTTRAELLAQAAKLPLVEVRVEIAVPSLQRGLGQKRADVERDVAQSVISFCRTHFGFLEWETQSIAERESSARLMLRVTEAPNAPRNVIPAIHVQYQFGHSVQSLERLNALLRCKRRLIDGQALAAVYPQNALPPVHDSEVITTALRNTIRSHFDHQDFRETLHSDFLTTVALTDKLTVDADAERVLIPIAVDWLRAKDDSQFRVLIASQLRPDKIQNGSLDLSKSGFANPKRFVQCTVVELKFPGHDFDRFHPILKEIVGKARAIQVFMWRYVPEPSIRGRLVTDL